jgi:hypothetical protein
MDAGVVCDGSDTAIPMMLMAAASCSQVIALARRRRRGETAGGEGAAVDGRDAISRACHARGSVPAAQNGLGLGLGEPGRSRGWREWVASSLGASYRRS